MDPISMGHNEPPPVAVCDNCRRDFYAAELATLNDGFTRWCADCLHNETPPAWTRITYDESPVYNGGGWDW